MGILSRSLIVALALVSSTTNSFAKASRTATSSQKLPTIHHSNPHRHPFAVRKQQQTARDNTPALDALVTLRGGGGKALAKGKTKKEDATLPPGRRRVVATGVFNLANNVAGAGILTLAAGKATGTGWIPAVGLVLGLAAVSAHTFSLVGKSCELTGLDSFRDLWAFAFAAESKGKKAAASSSNSSTAWLVDFMVFVQCFFVSILYTGLLGDVFSALLRGTLGIRAWWTTRAAIICLVSATVLFPLNLIKDLSALGFTSVLGLTAVLYTVGFIAVRALDGTYGLGNIDATSGVLTAADVINGEGVGKFVAGGLLPVLPSFAQSSWWHVDLRSLVLTSNLGLAFIAHYNAPSYWRSLASKNANAKQHPHQTAECFSAIANRAYLILAAIYATTMVCGYKTFGDHALGNILLNYASDDGLATLGRLATGLSIVFGFPLISNGCREGLKNVALAQGWTALADPQHHVPLVLGLLGVTTGLSLLADDVGLVAGLTGALMGSALVYVCPTLLYARIVGRVHGNGSEAYAKARRNLAWIPFGVFTAVLGVTMTLQNAR